MSAMIARQMEVEAGDRLIVETIERVRNGKTEVASVPLHVRDIILAEPLHGQATIFVDLALLIAAERFRDDYEVPLFGSSSGRPGSEMTEYASFRLYARDLRDVADGRASARPWDRG